ncbi:unnamed protein product [Sympodiomycopsis kandeliae]
MFDAANPETLADFCRRFRSQAKIEVEFPPAAIDQHPPLLPWVAHDEGSGGPPGFARTANQEARKARTERTTTDQLPQGCVISAFSDRWEAAHLIPHRISGAQFTWILKSLGRSFSSNDTQIPDQLLAVFEAVEEMTNNSENGSHGLIMQAMANDILPLSPDLHKALDGEELWLNPLSYSVSWLSSQKMPAALFIRNEMGPREEFKRYLAHNEHLHPSLFAASCRTLYVRLASRRLKAAFTNRAGQVLKYRYSQRKSSKNSKQKTTLRPPLVSSSDTEPSSDPLTSSDIIQSSQKDDRDDESGGGHRGGGAGTGPGGAGGSGKDDGGSRGGGSASEEGRGGFRSSGSKSFRSNGKAASNLLDASQVVLDSVALANNLFPFGDGHFPPTPSASESGSRNVSGSSVASIAPTSNSKESTLNNQANPESSTRAPDKQYLESWWCQQGTSNQALRQRTWTLQVQNVAHQIFPNEVTPGDQFHRLVSIIDAYLENPRDPQQVNLAHACARAGETVENVVMAMQNMRYTMPLEEAEITYSTLCSDWENEVFFLAWPTLLSGESLPL